jgi:hypothetical protein
MSRNRSGRFMLRPRLLNLLTALWNPRCGTLAARTDDDDEED